MAGVQNAAITVGGAGYPTGGHPYTACAVMNYNGTNWSVGTQTPTSVKCTSLSGTQNDVLSAGGYSTAYQPGSTTGWNCAAITAVRFNGTAWSSVSNLINNQ